MAEEAKNDTIEVSSKPTDNTEPNANTIISPPTDDDANLVSLHEPSSPVTILNLMQVAWDGPTDPANPKNWSQVKKWQITIMVAAFTFVSPISSSMTAPALQQIAEDLDITSSFERNMTLSIYVLALGIGPFFIGPLSEIYGRSKVLQLFNVVYLCFNLGCGFAQNASQLIACRFFAGIGGRYVSPLPSLRKWQLILSKVLLSVSAAASWGTVGQRKSAENPYASTPSLHCLDQQSAL